MDNMNWLQQLKTFAAHDWHLDDMHGASHWKRVERNALILATDEVNKNVVRAFAYLHDRWRLDNGWDVEHGPRAAQNIVGLRDTILSTLTDEEFTMLQTACMKHTSHHRTGNITIDTCFDADRLDLDRVGVNPDPYKMATERGRYYAMHYDEFLSIASEYGL